MLIWVASVDDDAVVVDVDVVDNLHFPSMTNCLISVMIVGEIEGRVWGWV